MQRTHKEFEITDDRSRLDFGVIQRWLAGAYWSTGITRAKVEQAAKHSTIVVGAFDAGNRQVGYGRVVSDRTRVAWVADVFVDPDHRGRGLGRAMVKFAIEHPDVVDVHNWVLGTKDAHGVYANLGFKTLEEPQLWMQFKRPQGL